MNVWIVEGFILSDGDAKRGPSRRVYRGAFRATCENEALMMGERECGASVDVDWFFARKRF